MRLDHIRERLCGLGAKPCHEEAVLRAWTQALPLASGTRAAENFLPRRLRDALPELATELRDLARLRSTHADASGAARLLVDLADGQSVESVLLPRDGVCVSTQVGCAVGCVFCMTGREGLQRSLASAEIVAAIELLGTAGGIGHKNLVFSTVGDRRVFDRLPRGRVKPALALSLHSTFDDRRQALLPRAPRLEPGLIVALGEDYARATHYPIQYQWTLLEGINDGDDEIEGIVRLLAGKYAVMNLIPYNAVDGLAFTRPAAQRASAMALALNEHGVLTKLRDSAAQAVEGGCGQLRARTIRLQPMTAR